MKLTLLILSAAFSLQQAALQLDSLVSRAISDSLFAGAVICYVDHDTIAFEQAYGYQCITPQHEPMTIHSIFDLASVSKSTGAGSAALCLINEGKLHKNDLVRQYLPAWQNDAQIHHLLEHTSGLPSYLFVRRLDSIYREVAAVEDIARPAYLMDTICRTPRLSEPGEVYRYSCLNFITLQNIVQRIVGQDLNSYMRARLYEPLGTEVMGWLPDAKYMDRMVSTEYLYSGTIEAEREAPVDSTQCLRGVVHDPLARVMNCGISGNAGIFATADDLAKWCVWLMNMTPEQRENACNCGLWTDEEDGSINHTGYTGTSFRLYPQEHQAMIILTNRVHPVDKGNLRDFRNQVKQILHPIQVVQE